jgi:glutamine amidotransferase
MIGIVYYGVGNVKAFENIYRRLDIPYKVITKIEDFKGISKLILPGVGAFDHAMEYLTNSGLKHKLDELVLEKKIPVLGICVGMQMLGKSSSEGRLPGLGWIDGSVVKITEKNKSDLLLPHMGWNNLTFKSDNRILKDINCGGDFYFLHSYCFVCERNDDVLATSDYGGEFDCIINHENIYGIQCHPEKSHSNGIQLLKNFGDL